MTSHVLSRGAIFAGRYKVEALIGSGGMGAVYEAEHLETERRVALKVLLPHALVTEGMRERFKQEARVAGRLRHPHIVDVLDAGVDEATDMPYLVMELLEGESLGARLEWCGALAREEALMLLLQTASALDRLHERSIVHRDLKPDNLFLTWAESGAPTVKLLDFGIAKVLEEGRTSAFTQDAQGTPVYMAPEQFAEQIRIAPATDIYALGMVAFALLTGRHYWGPEIERGMNVFMIARIAEGGPKELASVRAKAAGVVLSEAFDTWFATVTARIPGERYPTAAIAIEALAEALHLPLSPRPVRMSRRPPALRSSPRPPVANDDPRTAPGSTPPLLLERRRAFWRRPFVMITALLGPAAIVAAVMLLTGDPPSSPRPAFNAMAPGAATQIVTPPAVTQVVPPAAAVPSLPELDAGALAVPGASASVSSPAPPPATKRPPVVATPGASANPGASASAAHPKYTRD